MACAMPFQVSVPTSRAITAEYLDLIDDVDFGRPQLPTSGR
jgi:hypothetical protein